MAFFQNYIHFLPLNPPHCTLNTSQHKEQTNLAHPPHSCSFDREQPLAFMAERESDPGLLIPHITDSCLANTVF